MLFEIFKPDIETDQNKLNSGGLLVSSIESAVFEECKEDARCKAFRDKIKSI